MNVDNERGVSKLLLWCECLYWPGCLLWSDDEECLSNQRLILGSDSQGATMD